ncbi:hypothetical protein FTUN_3382 [Frigoriglobus tundricola]|uniref:Uncharacterized protein n=1 Tax=Frigoriglobus tundricola TaxID=2774151 RepID=A0A6M5YPI2_9BACT|nr:hypothetical protein FTUN_3382 [Frigoriglobus tundricola]
MTPRRENRYGALDRTARRPPKDFASGEIDTLTSKRDNDP